jgi:hypothetical protein
MRLLSAKDALLARLNIVRKRMHWYTIAILIWLTFLEIIHLFLWGGAYTVQRGLPFEVEHYSQWELPYLLGSLCYTISYILWALAIVGMIAYYSRSETSSRLRWGPLCGIAGAVAYFGGAAAYFGGPVVYNYSFVRIAAAYGMSPLQVGTWSVLVACFYGPVLVGIPSYIEYLIEGRLAMRKKMNKLTIALLVSMIFWGIYLLIPLYDLPGGFEPGRYSAFTVILYGLPPSFLFGSASVLYALAIIGIINYYRLGEKAPRLRWGPLCGIVAVAFNLVGFVFLGYLMGKYTIWTAFYAALFVTVGWPSYVEYLKEGAPVTMERLAQVVLSQRLSAALTRQVKDIEGAINQTRERVKIGLTLLTVALPIIVCIVAFVVAVVVPLALDFDLLIAIIYAGAGISFLAIAAWFSSLLKKPRYTLLTINHSNASLDSIAASQVRTIVKDARKRLAIFLLACGAPVCFVVLTWLLNYYYGDLKVIASASLILLSALICFLTGYWVLTRSSMAVAPLNEPALREVLEESVGVLPNKVRAGEAHSVLMDFNITSVSPSAVAAVTRSAPGSIGDVLASDADALRSYYETELQAAGATVDSAKQCLTFDAPTTCNRIWNCSFSTVGSQVLHLLFNEVRPARAQVGDDAFARETLFAYVHNVRVEGRLTGSSDKTISIIGVIGTAAGAVASVLPFVVPFVVQYVSKL